MAYVYRGKHRIADEPTPTEQQVSRNHPTLKPCGTDAAYKRHIRRRETACDPCKDAHAAQLAKDRGGNHTGKRRRTTPECGTYSGAVQHRKKGEPVDFACRRAESEYNKARYEKKKATAA